MKRRLKRRSNVRGALLAIMAFPLAGVLGGCTSLAVGAGATVAAAAAEERGLAGAANDLAIETAITALWIKEDSSLVTDLDIAISEGRVLLTGAVATPARRLTAVRLAWRVSGVKSVINKIEVRSPDGLGSYARDAWITARLISRLAFDRDVSYINYTVETVNRTIYLMGIAQDQAELDRVLGHARQVRYVRRVSNHVRLKTDPRRNRPERSRGVAGLNVEHR